MPAIGCHAPVPGRASGSEDDNRAVPSRDALLIYAAAFLRSSTVGLVGVLLAISLAEHGVSVAAIGLIIGAGLAGIALVMAAVAVAGDRFGRRHVLMALAALMALGYVGAATFSHVIWLVPVAFLGMLNGMGRDRSAAGALEQAILPQTSAREHRTWNLAWYNLVLDIGHAFGALASAAPALAVAHLGWSSGGAHQTTLLLCAAAAAAAIVPYAFLSNAIEAERSPGSRPHAADTQTTHSVHTLAALFAIDSLGSGFLSTALIAYWFFERHGFSETDLAILFFAARLLNAVSHVVAAWLAGRIGLLNTMVFTHLPSSLLLLIAPATASGAVAAGLFLARESLVEMDVPTRQSYVMAIVPPEHRTYASGVTNLTRTLGWALGPPFAGLIMQNLAFGAPLLIGGSMKIAYDLLLYGSFRRMRPPEEAGTS